MYKFIALSIVLTFSLSILLIPILRISFRVDESALITDSPCNYGDFTIFLISKAPTNAPTNLTTTVLSPNIISVTWDPPVSIDRNGVISHYTLSYKGIERDTASRDIILYSYQSYFTNYVLTNLDEHTSYDIAVSASTATGSGPIATVRAQTDQDGEPPAAFVLCNFF